MRHLQEFSNGSSRFFYQADPVAFTLFYPATLPVAHTHFGRVVFGYLRLLLNLSYVDFCGVGGGKIGGLGGGLHDNFSTS